jgi:hypothetical protein
MVTGTDDSGHVGPEARQVEEVFESLLSESGIHREPLSEDLKPYALGNDRTDGTNS